MLRCWLSLANLVSVVAFIVAGAGRLSKLVHGICKPYPIVKTFTMPRYTTNDTEVASNDTCTIQIPAFQCGGFCETSAEPSFKGLTYANGVYEMKFEEKCKCCEALKSGTIEIRVAPNTFECQGNPGVKWDKEIVYKSVSARSSCTCRTCRGTRTLPQPQVD